MQLERQNSDLNARERDIVAREASSGRPSEDFQKMARRRFQDPKPVRRGHWWTLLVWKDHFVGAERKRKREPVRLAPSTMLEREVLKIAAEHLRLLNQGLVLPGKCDSRIRTSIWFGEGYSVKARAFTVAEKNLAALAN